MAERKLFESAERKILYEALKAGMSDVELSCQRGCEMGENYLGDITKVVVTGLKDSKIHKLNFIVKSKYGTDNSYLDLMFENELNAFTKILPAFNISQKHFLELDERFIYSEFYGGQNSAEKFIIMEDMSEKGFRKIGKRVAFDVYHLIVAIKALARFHATSFVFRKGNPDLYAEFAALIYQKQDYNNPSSDIEMKCHENLLALITDPETHGKFKKFLKDKTVNYQAYFKPELTGPYNIIVHGDCWSGNILFKDQDGIVTEAVMLDWQTLLIASPVTDLLQLIFLCTEDSVRSAYLLKIFDFYYEVLSKNITKMNVNMEFCYPKEVYQDHLQSMIPLGLFVSISYLPLLFADKDEEPNFENWDEGSTYLIPYSDLFKERFRGVVKTFIEFGFI